MNTVLLALFLTACAAHLLFCLLEKPLPQKITKVLLMPLLLLWLWAASPELPWLVAAAVACGWLGDVLLLWPDRQPCFLGGLAAFLIGHGFYVIALVEAIDRWPSPLTLLVAGIVLIAVGGAAYATLRRNLADMRLPVIAYLLVILTMAFFAVAGFFSPRISTLQYLPAGWALWNTPRGLACLGAASFVVSDYLLARSLFLRRFAKCDFWVMLTYLAAQFLLAASLAGIF